MNKRGEQLEDYVSDLEEKIVDLSFKLKNKSAEQEKQAELNSLVFKKLVHNLKNPVGVAFSFSEMMLHDFRNYTEEKLEKHLSIIYNSSQFSIDLLNKFAFFSRYQSTDLNFELLDQNLVSLIKKVIKKVETLARDKDISIVCNIPDSIVLVKFDANELEIALENVLNNAIRFSNEPSEIHVSISQKNNEVTIKVEDQGIGISSDNLANLGKEFFVVNTYSADSKKCIGLGMPIALKIIKLHNGSISFKSELNIGTTVEISLPLS